MNAAYLEADMTTTPQRVGPKIEMVAMTTPVA